MSLADLIAARSSSASLEESSVPAGPSEAVIPSASVDEGSSSEELTSPDSGEPEKELTMDEEAETSELSAADSPFGVKKQSYPGIDIYYQAGPKRLYKINEKQVGSVSEAIDILEKGGLPWWGMKIGIEGLQTVLLEAAHNDPNGNWFNLLSAPVEDVVDVLKAKKLTVNHVRDNAGDRGTNVHTALELWAEKGIAPQPGVYAPEEQPYVQGLADFLIDSGAEAVASEVMVGSLKHKYAGRYDLEAKLPKGAEVVVKAFDKNASIRWRLPEALYLLLDLKTSKDVYDTHFIQLEGYEEARKECGLEPTDYRGVIHVRADGKYELRLNITHFAWNDKVKSDRYRPKFYDGKPLATFTDFKHVLALKKALDRIKGRK